MRDTTILTVALALVFISGACATPPDPEADPAPGLQGSERPPMGALELTTRYKACTAAFSRRLPEAGPCFEALAEEAPPTSEVAAVALFNAAFAHADLPGGSAHALALLATFIDRYPARPERLDALKTRCHLLARLDEEARSKTPRGPGTPSRAGDCYLHLSRDPDARDPLRLHESACEFFLDHGLSVKGIQCFESLIERAPDHRHSDDWRRIIDHLKTQP